MLADELSKARAEAESALSKQSAWLSTGDLSDEKARPQLDSAVRNAVQHEKGVSKALDEFNKKIVEARQQLDQQRDQQARADFSKELRTKCTALDTKVQEYKKIAQDMLSAMQAITVQHQSPDFLTRCAALVTELPTVIAQFSTEGRQHADAIESGIAAIPGVRAEPEKPAALPHIAKREVYVLQDSKWTEHGETKTAAKYSPATVPEQIAARAVKVGLAHPVDSPLVARLREQHGDRRAVVVAMECIDLETGERPAGGVKYESGEQIGTVTIGQRTVDTATLAAV